MVGDKGRFIRYLDSMDSVGVVLGSVILASSAAALLLPRNRDFDTTASTWLIRGAGA